jgi:ABC-type nickel/cobalt efflux system permease component RcnA
MVMIRKLSIALVLVVAGWVILTAPTGQGQEAGGTDPALSTDDPAPLTTDLNQDDKFDHHDLDAFTKCCPDGAGHTVGDCTDAQKAAADLNDDGVVDIKDFRKLVRRREKTLAAQQD